MSVTHAQAVLNARESVAVWTPLLAGNLTPLWPLLGCETGETGFDFRAVGDHDAAFGPFQHHLPRILFIRQHTGIDIRTASHADQLRAVHWEMSAGVPGNSYRHVWDALLASTSEVGCMHVLVHDYEQSRNQATDIVRRMALAEYWRGVLAS